MNETTDVVKEATTELLQSTSPIIETVKSFLTLGTLFKILSVFLIVLILWLIFKALRRGSKKLFTAKFSVHIAMLIDRFLKYLFFILAAMYILGACGIKLTALMGAAGVAGLAIGFAAQTSVSNVISGVFVLAEKSMKVGDLITIGDVTGIVDAIDLLSIKVHTPDNQFVRIPNSTVVNSNLRNTTYHTKRRFTMPVSVSYDTDLQKALDTLKTVPSKCEHAIKDNPAFPSLVW